VCGIIIKNAAQLGDAGIYEKDLWIGRHKQTRDQRIRYQV